MADADAAWGTKGSAVGPPVIGRLGKWTRRSQGRSRRGIGRRESAHMEVRGSPPTAARAAGMVHRPGVDRRDRGAGATVPDTGAQRPLRPRRPHGVAPAPVRSGPARDWGPVWRRAGAADRGDRAGDTVQAGAGEWHWHGAGPGTFMTHLAVQQADTDGRTSEWGEHVTDEEYRSLTSKRIQPQHCRGCPFLMAHVRRELDGGRLGCARGRARPPPSSRRRPRASAPRRLRSGTSPWRAPGLPRPSSRLPRFPVNPCSPYLYGRNWAAKNTTVRAPESHRGFPPGTSSEPCEVDAICGLGRKG